MRHRSSLLLLGLSCGSWSCSGPGSPEPAARERSRYCAALCERQAACELAARPGCRPLCENDPSARGRSDEVWALQAGCIAARSCAEWQGGSPRVSCLEAALRALPPSDSCIAYCTDGAVRAFECGGGHSITECVRGPACAYRDDILEDANLCNAELDCDERARCIAGAFGTL